jgi:hypothetical protein
MALIQTHFVHVKGVVDSVRLGLRARVPAADKVAWVTLDFLIDFFSGGSFVAPRPTIRL